MKKIIITSSIMKKAHMATKAMKKEFPEINYRIQLGLEISKLLKDEREYQLEVTLRVKTLNWMKKYINHNNKLDREDLELLSNKMNYDLGIKRFGFTQSYTMFDLAKEIVKRYSLNILRYLNN
jgi:hypothetical protein